MRRYVFQVVIEEGNDEFWEEIINNYKTGCDEVTELLNNAVGDLDCTEVKLIEYTNKD